MIETIVAFENVTKTYDGTLKVVDGLNLELLRGEFMTLLGPSGSGKTTTLMMLAGFEELTSGSIRLDGQEINNVPSHRRNIGVVFQNYALFPHMSVGENLSFPLEMRGLGKVEREELVRDALAMIRLEGVLNRKPGQLSGGQQQRVALARALIFKPKLVLMDEPLGALDKQLREHMQLEIVHLHQQLNVTVVYVTHDQSEALMMSDRVAVFSNGKIQQLASPNVVYNEPSNSFVASFVGENNRLDGKVVRSDRSMVDVMTDDGIPVAAQASAALTVGDRVMISIRPEKVFFDAVRPKDNWVKACVEEVTYFGDHSKVRVSIPGAKNFMVRTSLGEAALVLEKGALLDLTWARSDCRAIPIEALQGN